MDWGMQNRMSQLIQPDGHCFFMPIDHGYFQGPTQRLEKPGETVKPLLPYCDALFVTRGILRSCIDPTNSKPIILRVSGGTSLAGQDLAHEGITTSVPDAVRLNVAAVGISIFVGSEYYEGTNLREAELTVNVSQDPEMVSRCLKIAPYEQDMGEIVLNGTPFQVSLHSEGAAGSLYDMQIFRTAYKGTCYHIYSRIRSTNIGVFGPDTTIQEYDQDGISSFLKGALSTFRFIP